MNYFLIIANYFAKLCIAIVHLTRGEAYHARTCCSRKSFNLSKKMPSSANRASMLLCPAPSTQKGFARYWIGVAKNSSCPFQKGTISSLRAQDSRHPHCRRRSSPSYTSQIFEVVTASQSGRPTHLVPCTIRTGHFTFRILSMFGNISPGSVKRKLNATR